MAMGGVGVTRAGQSMVRWVAVLVLFVSAGGARADSLLGVWRAALASDPVVAQAQADLDAESQSRPLARSAWWPHMALSGGFAENQSGIVGLGNPFSGRYPSNNLSVTLTQSLFNGQAWTALSQADQRIRAREADLVGAEQGLASRVAIAYFGVLEAEALARVAAEQEHLLGTLLQQAQAALEIGTGDVIAVEAARARRDAAQADRIRTDSAVAVARRTLQRLTHGSLPGALDDLGALTPLPPDPARSEAWVDAALDHQPRIEAAQARLAEAHDAVEFARRARWPVVNAQGGVVHSVGSPFPALDINQRVIGLNLSVPIFDGGQISAQVDQAGAQARSLEAVLNDVRDDVTLSTRSAYIDLSDSVARFEAARTARDSARLAYDSTRAGYGLGTRSLLDVLTVASDRVAAEQGFETARYAHVRARIALKGAAGVLSSADIEALDRLLVHPVAVGGDP